MFTCSNTCYSHDICLVNQQYHFRKGQDTGTKKFNNSFSLGVLFYFSSFLSTTPTSQCLTSQQFICIVVVQSRITVVVSLRRVKRQYCTNIHYRVSNVKHLSWSLNTVQCVGNLNCKNGILIYIIQ